MATGQKTFLHVGCGALRQAQAGPGFRSPERWRELRLDIDPKAEPDVIGSITDMSAIADSSMDALYSSHNIEHLYPHDVPVALAEFRRVLGPDGFAVITCPDLQSVCALVAQDKLTEPAYQSNAGPIAPLDILYGHRAAMAAGNLYMAHRTGFTLRSLMAELQAAGFGAVIGGRRPQAFDLWVLASKPKLDDPALRALAAEMLPR